MSHRSVKSLLPLIDSIIENNDRNNKEKNNSYWYPLNVATYDSLEIMEALDSLCNFQTTMSKKTREFEIAFSNQFGGEAIMVNSGSSADLLIAFALHEQSGGPLKSGDEILIPAVTWPTQLWSVLMAGFSAKLVDVDPDTFNISIESLKKSISKKTKALFLVHLMGNSSNMNEIKKICDEFNLILLEDCCESLGTESCGAGVGSFGLMSSYSFFFSHHITTMEGGMIVTKDKSIANRLKLLRSHGWSRELDNIEIQETGLDSRYTFVNWGFNVRPTELQAGFGLVQLQKFPKFQEMRKLNIDFVKSEFSIFSEWVNLMKVPKFVECSWFSIPFLLNPTGIKQSREHFLDFLEFNGVETRPIVAGNLALQPATRKISSISWGELVGADYIHKNGFYIGLHPFNSIEKLGRVLELFKNYQKNFVI